MKKPVQSWWMWTNCGSSRNETKAVWLLSNYSWFLHMNESESHTEWCRDYRSQLVKICGEKLARNAWQNKHREDNGTGSDIVWEERLSALPNRCHNGYVMAKEEENHRIRRKESLRKTWKYKLKAPSCTVCEILLREGSQKPPRPSLTPNRGDPFEFRRQTYHVKSRDITLLMYESHTINRFVTIHSCRRQTDWLHIVKIINCNIRLIMSFIF